jgi:hypothetical protein
MMDAEEIDLISAVEYFLKWDKKFPIPTHYLDSWIRALDPTCWVIDSEILRQTLLPAYHLLKPQHTAQELVLPSWRQNSGKLDPALADKQQLSTALRAEDGVPLVLKQRHPELKAFSKYIKSIPEPEKVQTVVAVVLLEQGFNYLIYIDLKRGKLEIVACVLQKVPDRVATEIIHVLAWFSLFRFKRRVSATEIVRGKIQIPFTYCTVLGLFYSMLRMHFNLTMEKAGRAVTVNNLNNFLKHFLSTSCLDFEIILYSG